MLLIWIFAKDFCLSFICNFSSKYFLRLIIGLDIEDIFHEEIVNQSKYDYIRKPYKIYNKLKEIVRALVVAIYIHKLIYFKKFLIQILFQIIKLKLD